MGRDKEGNPGYYDILHPNYTIFHEDDHTFSDVWTGYTEDFKTFYKNMRDDMETYKDVKAVKAKPGQPQNFYCISMVPWLNFTGYSAYTESGTPMLFPIITCGKFTEHDGILTMPFCVNIAHAAADGYHIHVYQRTSETDRHDRTLKRSFQASCHTEKAVLRNPVLQRRSSQIMNKNSRIYK